MVNLDASVPEWEAPSWVVEGVPRHSKLPRGEGTNGTSPPADGLDFAKVLMRDPYTPCVYLCDLSRQYQPSFPICYTPGCALASAWDTLPQSSVADNCPEVAAQGSRDFSASSLMIPSGVHLLAYGHSYMNQIFRVLLAANGPSLVRVESTKAVRVSPEYVRKGDPDRSLLCAGDDEFVGPKCNGALNCGYQDFVRYHLSNGATLTGVFNNYDLQSRPTDDDAGTAGVVANLTRFIRAGAGENTPYTHAWVMEPHGFSFSNYQRLVSLAQQDPSKHSFPPFWQESSYGCGWSDAFWAVWNNEMPGKVHHVFPWGYSPSEIHPAAPTPAINLDEIFQKLPCHTDAAYPGLADGFAPESPKVSLDLTKAQAPQFFPNYSMRNPRRNQNQIEGHLCIATKDATGYYLGPVAYMATAALEPLLRPPANQTLPR